MGEVWLAPAGTDAPGAGTPPEPWTLVGRTATCLSCGTELDGLPPRHNESRWTLLVLDGVLFRGPIPEGDPARLVAVAREPFCKRCHDTAPSYGARRG